MRKANLYATTALGLCLIPASGSVSAQTVEVTPDELALFAPLVQPCIDAPESDACAPVRSLVAECAEDMTFAQCEVLFEDGVAVFDDPELVARVQEILQNVDDVMPDFSEQTAGEGGMDVNDDVRAEAERTLLLGDENLLTHSTPPVQEGEAREGLRETLENLLNGSPDAEEPPVEEDIETPVETARDPEPEIEAPEADAELETDDAEPVAEEELETETTPEPEVTDQVDADPTTPAPMEEGADDATATLEAMRRLLEGDTSVADTPTDDPAEDAARDEVDRLLEEERERLRAEADDMAEDAPELVVEDLPEEEVVAPQDAPVELNATQRAAVEQLMENPEVSSALGVLSSMLAAQTPDGEATDDAAAADFQASMEEDATSETADIIEEQITREQLRTSGDDFISRMAMDFDADAQAQTQRSSSGRRDLERAGLVALGALAVGMMINQNRVVARSDERVVVQQNDGDLAIWRDDDAILLEDGSTRRIERFSDGSTRTRWQRVDGTQVVTIRDATGRVLRRERVLADGTIVELVNDLRPVEAIDVSILPPPRSRELRITPRTDPDLAIAMLREAEAEARALDRSYSLRQIRENRELRELLPLLSPDPITFETNRANVRTEEATKLLQVGRLMERLIAENPREVFLIEGHTDATGPAAFNLGLSDRRAESVALALTEFFDIPPENLIVQGYGERYLRIPTLNAEERNRRVAIRRITPLMNL